MSDTIAALATAPARSAVGVIRLSGPESVQIAKRCFNGKRNMEQFPRELIYGDMLDSGSAVIDRGLAVYLQGPKSYTGEDTVEFYCHGSITVLNGLLDALYQAGARPAQPGEYTRRAYLNGKMDLTQAEAVIDLIDSETVGAARNAAAQMEGKIGGKIRSARNSLLDIASGFYAYVDYPDDGAEEFDSSAAVSVLQGVALELKVLADSFSQGRLLKDGIRCAIVGRPNVGKSSVLNAILGYERSIVTAIAGTTRDTVEESASLGGLLLRLIDTAGLRDTADTVERLGVERARKAVEDAHLCLAVFDGSQPMTQEDALVIDHLKGRRTIALINKSDLPAGLDQDKITNAFGDEVCIISATERSGLDVLSDKIKRLFSLQGLSCDGSLVTNPRHAHALRQAAQASERAWTALESGLTPDVAVTDVEAAINALGELTGQTASEEILHRIFERFCVGK